MSLLEFTLHRDCLLWIRCVEKTLGASTLLYSARLLQTLSTIKKKRKLHFCLVFSVVLLLISFRDPRVGRHQ